MADFDDLYDVADLAVHWIEHHPCPDKQLEKRLRAQMMGYRAVVDTVRCTITEENGDLMVARLSHLRRVIDLHAEAIVGSAQETEELEGSSDGEIRILPVRRRVPRQLAGWSGTCVMDNEPETERRECRIVDISCWVSVWYSSTLRPPTSSMVASRCRFPRSMIVSTSAKAS